MTATRTEAVTDGAPDLDPSKTSQKETSRLTGADGLRALACLGVLAHHAFQRYNPNVEGGWLVDVHGFLIKGGVGVGVFFVLSGMLLSYRFWMSYFTKKAYPSIRHYIRRRASRILPGFYLALGVSFLVANTIATNAGTEVESAGWRLLSGVTLTSSFHYVTFFPTEANGPLWAIPMEAVCYVLLPLAMWGLYAIKKRGTWRGLAFWLGVIAVAAVLHQLVINTFDITGDWSTLIEGAKNWMPGRNPIGYFGHFAIGVLASAGIVLWKIHKDGRRSWWWDGIALAMTLGLVAFFWAQRLPAEYDGAPALQDQPYYYPYFAIMLAVLAVSLGFSKGLWKLYDNAFFTFTAKYSFGIYLWHMLIFDWFGRSGLAPDFWYGGITDPWRHLQITLAAVAVTYVVAMLSWHVWEKHWTEGRLSGLLQRKKVDAA